MALPQAGVELVAEGLSGFVSDMNKAGAAVTDFGKSGDSASKGFGGFQEIVTGALREVGALAVDAMGKAAQAVGAFVKDSIGLAGDFQQGMLEFQAVAGKDVDTKGLEKFQDLFLTLGKELPVSTADVQKAAIEMVKGGIDPATVAAGGLRQNIQFAAAAMGGDLVEAATISAKILGGWTDAGASAQERADFLTHSTDMLTKAANASSVDVHELSLGIFNAQGIAKTAGVSFDDLTTTLAALSPRFASSSEAGNSLKNVISRLQPTTDKAAQYMLDLGLITEEGGNKFFDAQGKFVGFQQTAEILKTSLVGLTEQQKTQYLQQIFGNDAMNAAAALADLGAAGYDHMADSLSKANGVQENAALKQQGFNTAMENAKGSVEALQITIGSALLPVLTDLLNNVVAPGVNILTDLATGGKVSDETFSKLSPTMQAVATAVQGFFNDLQNGIATVQMIVGTIQGMIDAFNQGGGAADTLGSAVNDLSGIWDKAISVVEDVANGYKDIIDSVLPVVAKFVAEHGDEISGFFKTTWDSIIQIVNLALDLYDAIVPPVLHAIAGFIDAHGSEIQKVMKGAWDLITSIIKGTLDTIKGVIQVALDVIHGDWSKAWTDIKGIADTQVTAIGGAIKGFLNMIAGLFNTSMGEIADTWRNNWNMFVEIVSKIADRMVAAGADIVAGIREGIAGAWDSLMGWVKDKVSGLVNAALDAVGAHSPATKFMPVGQFAVQGIMEGFSNWWPSLTNLVAGLGDDLVKQAADIGTSIQSAISDAFGATATIDRQIAANLDKFKDILPQYQQYTQGALKQAEQQARQFLDPQEGAKFFQMRSKQILEYAKLQQQLAEAQTDEDRDRIKQQMLLINAAQTAEINAFNANLDATKSGTEKLLADIQALMTAKGTNAKGKEVSLPGILEDPTIAALASLLGQAFAPPASAQQIYGGGGTTTSYNSTQNWNMPIYTNQSPGVLQDSMAIAQASMT